MQLQLLLWTSGQGALAQLLMLLLVAWVVYLLDAGEASSLAFPALVLTGGREGVSAILCLATAV